MVLPNFSSMNIDVTLVTATISVLSAIGLYYFKNKKKEKIPETWEAVGKVTNLYLYPLKSGRRLPLKRADCTEIGFKVCTDDEKAFQLQDRLLVVYGGENNEFKTARTYPKMILIEVGVHDTKHLSLDAPGMRQLYVKVPLENEKAETKIFMRGEILDSFDFGDEAASWVSRYLLDKDSGFRLAYYHPEYKRDAKITYSKFMKVYPNVNDESMGKFTDFGSCLLVNEASVRDLNERIENSNVTHENFRPNIVIDGENLKAFEEDNWEWIKIGDVVFRVAMPCTRCMLTTINPNDGVRNTNREPLNTLEKYRLFKDSLSPKSPVMGTFTNIRTSGQIKVDDCVYIGKSS